MSDIPGWMTPIEMKWLSETASRMQTVLEVGSWLGRSTRVLLENCPGLVYSVDHWQGSEGNVTLKLARDNDIFRAFWENVKGFPNLRILKMSSGEAAEIFSKKVDMVFIDGDHSYPSVLHDILVWLPKCKRVIAGHDYPEVKTAVDQTLESPSLLKDGSIWWKELCFTGNREEGR